MKLRKQINHRLSVFPNVKVEAWYDSITQIIHLNSVERSESEQPRTLRLLSHEVQHWLDHVSTLWGQRSLLRIFAALETYLNMNESSFWRLRSLWRSLNRDRLHKYYSVNCGLNNGSKWEPWVHQLSCGMKFDSEGKLSRNDPILFCRFSSQGGSGWCRVPFTIESLLEVNAVARELAVIAYCEDDLVNQRINSEDVLRMLYDSDLVAYSVAVHHLANCLGLKDANKAFAFAKEVSTLALSIPDMFFDELRIPTLFEPFENMNQQLINRRDRGYLFAALCQNYRETLLDPAETPVNLDAIVQASGLPQLKEIESAVVHEMESIYREAQTLDNADELCRLLRLGLELFIDQGLLNRSSECISTVIQKGDGPTVVFGDDIFDDHDAVSILHNEGSDFLAFLADFNSICGI